MDEPSSINSQRSKKRAKISLATRVSLVLVVVLAGSTSYFAWQYNKSRQEVKRLQNPQNSIKQEADELRAKVAQLVDLPNEVPTVATVSDVAKLKNQTFFVKAENGDKVLIFQNAARAVLYRPSTNKVIEYAPVNLGSNSKQ